MQLRLMAVLAAWQESHEETLSDLQVTGGTGMGTLQDIPV
jgi:hypothetical protein